MGFFVLYVSILVMFLFYLLKTYKQSETGFSVSQEARNLLFPLETAISEQEKIVTFSL